MKKLFCCVLTLVMLMLLSACGGGSSVSATESETGTGQTTETEESSGNTDMDAPITGTDISSVGKTVSPLESDMKLDELNDNTFAASFGPEDVAVDADGNITLTLAVYDYERFDMVDIAALEVGDILVIEGNTAPVTQLEEGENHIKINGGYDAGGYDLYTDDDGVYYENIEEYGKIYYELGKVTLPVSSDFVLTDNSDPQNQGVTMDAEGLINLSELDLPSFAENSTTVRTEGGEIVEVTREYRP